MSLLDYGREYDEARVGERGRPLYYQAGPGEQFGIATGDDWAFEVVPARNANRGSRLFSTRIEVLEAHLSGLEVERVNLMTAIAKAKRLRRAWKLAAAKARESNQ